MTKKPLINKNAPLPHKFVNVYIACSRFPLLIFHSIFFFKLEVNVFISIMFSFLRQSCLDCCPVKTLAQDDIKIKLMTCIYTLCYTNIVIHCTLVLPVQIFSCLSQIKSHFFIIFSIFVISSQELSYRILFQKNVSIIHPTLQLRGRIFVGRKPDLIKDTQ